jgi:hypothetical protein
VGTGVGATEDSTAQRDKDTITRLLLETTVKGSPSRGGVFAVDEFLDLSIGGIHG